VNLFCDERHVGELQFSGGNCRLELTNTVASPLSPHFPIHKGSIVESEALQSFFINYLPEEPFATRVAARLFPSPRNIEDWFIALGQELTGAYALTPIGVDLSRAEYVDLPYGSMVESMQSSRSRADAMSFRINDSASQPRLSLAGAQDKFALWFDAHAKNRDQQFKIPRGRAASTHIFKPESTDTRYPMLPANEYACTQLARVIGLAVPDCDVLTIGGVRTLVTKRFDRRIVEGQVKRIHQIDLCQMLNLPRERKYASQNAGIDTEQFFVACANTSIPILARRAHLRAWIFNFLIGNQDAHAKNYSFLYNKGWEVAPLYDLICVSLYLPDQTLSMGLLHEYRPGWFDRDHWLNLALLAGVTPTYLAQEIFALVQGVQAASKPLAALINETLLDDEVAFLSQKINPVIVHRAELLRQAASSLLDR
jgi:serine/threonine-protein kinase HipA